MIEVAKVNVIVHSALYKLLLSRLTSIGVRDIYSFNGRGLILNDRSGLNLLFRNSDIVSEAVEVLHFFVPIELEDQIISYITRAIRLDIPGRGSVFTQHQKIIGCKNLESLIHPISIPENQKLSVPVFENLVQINCTLPRGTANELGRLLLHIGLVPTITNATGSGIRDKLGLLRITIPKDKEVISVITGPKEANTIMEKMILLAKLDRPGRGFIWLSQVRKGIINIKTSSLNVGHAASTEQIIAAIDSIKGSMSWRQGNSGIQAISRRQFLHGSEIYLNLNEGHSIDFAKFVLKFGVTGATIQSPRLLAPNVSQDQHIVPPREVVQIVLADSLIDKILESCMVLNIFNEENNGLLLTSKILRAFTYLRT